MTEDKGQYRRDKRLQRNWDLTGIQLNLIRALHMYAPGPVFWNHVMPTSDLDSLSMLKRFETDYYKMVPSTIGDRVDRLLLNWMTKAVDETHFASEMNILIAEVQTHHQNHLSSDDYHPEEDLIGELISHLQDLKEAALEDGTSDRPAHREKLQASIEDLREAMLFNLKSDGDKPLGRG